MGPLSVVDAPLSTPLGPFDFPLDPIGIVRIEPTTMGVAA
jgi:hypothetical protein